MTVLNTYQIFIELNVGQLNICLFQLEAWRNCPLLANAGTFQWLLICAHFHQADSFKMGHAIMKSSNSIEHLLGLSRGDKTSMDGFSNAGRESVAGNDFLFGGSPAGGGAGDRVEHLLSSVNSRGTSMDSLPR